MKQPAVHVAGGSSEESATSSGRASESSCIQAWHFVGDKLRDGSRIPKDGEVLRYTGRLEMCASGLHASREPFNALQYAPGQNLCLVRCGGETIECNDKLVCSERTIIARMDATDMLRYFSRMQALSVIHLWEAPDVVCDYLMTGDESLRAAARDAAGAAARAAAGAAARAAAGDAARDAARKDFNALTRECFWQFLEGR